MSLFTVLLIVALILVIIALVLKNWIFACIGLLILICAFFFREPTTIIRNSNLQQLQKLFVTITKNEAGLI